MSKLINYGKLAIVSLVLIIICGPVTTPSLGYLAVDCMDTYGIINDAAAWKKIKHVTNHGRTITSAHELNAALLVANRHSSAYNATGQLNIGTYPTLSHVQGKTIINVPEFYATNPQQRHKYQQTLRHYIRLAGPTVYLNFVNNTGGDVITMTAGLVELLSDGTLWTVVDRQQHHHPVKLQGNHLTGGFTNLDIHLSHRHRLTHRKIIIFTNNITASAAEFLLLALKREPDCHIIGQPTAGFTSDNQWILLGAEKWAMSLTVGTLLATKPIQGQRAFNNQPIQPDVWATHVPRSNKYTQTPLDPDFLNEVDAAHF